MQNTKQFPNIYFLVVQSFDSYEINSELMKVDLNGAQVDCVDNRDDALSLLAAMPAEKHPVVISGDLLIPDEESKGMSSRNRLSAAEFAEKVKTSYPHALFTIYSYNLDGFRRLRHLEFPYERIRQLNFYLDGSISKNDSRYANLFYFIDQINSGKSLAEISKLTQGIECYDWEEFYQKVDNMMSNTVVDLDF